jgi:hypothetical protein
LNKALAAVAFVMIHEITKKNAHFLLQIWWKIIPKVFHVMIPAVSYKQVSTGLGAVRLMVSAADKLAGTNLL